MNEKTLSLPPRVDGNIRATIELRIEAIHFSSTSTNKKLRGKTVKVFVRWWGQSLSEGLYFSPRIVHSSSLCRDFSTKNGIRVAVYKVVTGCKRFREYLQDAERLFLEIHCLDENREPDVIGYCIVENLERIVEFQSLDSTLDIFDESGGLVGKLRCKLEYVRVDDDPDTSESIRLDNTRLKDFTRVTPCHAVTPSTQQEKMTSTLNPGHNSDEVAEISNSAEVVASDREKICQKQKDKNLESVYFTSDTTEGRDVQVFGRKVTFADHFSNHEAEDVPGRSLEREYEDEGRTRKEIENIEDHDDEYIQKNYQENVSTSHVENFRHGSRRWNLSLERLKFVRHVDQFHVHIRKIQFSSEFLAALSSVSRFEKRPSWSAPRQHHSASEKRSLFVTFIVPPGGNAVTCCSLKRNKNIASKSSEEVFFDNKTQHKISFDDATIDLWFTQSLNFKLFSRALNQRVPTYLGEASFGLKHLLITDRYAGGRELRIPIYAARGLTRELSEHQQSISEIIGDLFLDLRLSREEKASTYKSSTGSHSSQKHQSGNRLVVAEAPTKDESSANEIISSPEVLPVQSGINESKPAVTIQTLLVISEGRNFCLQDPSVQNLFVSCRFMGSGNLLTSQICWDIQKPSFSFRHAVPFSLDETFLEHCCKSNFLILEVWSFADPKDKLIGVATVPLHPIFVAYKDRNRREAMLALEYPVVTTDYWIDVHDVLSGEVVGALRVLFSVGTEFQIENYLSRPSRPPSRCDPSPAPQVTPMKNEEQIYDSVTSITDPACDQARKSSIVSESKTDFGDEKIEIDSSQADSTVRLHVTVEEARNLPRIKNREYNRRLPPNCYVTLPNFCRSTDKNFVSRVVYSSSRPQWNFSRELKIPYELLSSSKHHLIVKVWHCPYKPEQTPTSDKFQNEDFILTPDFDRDPIIGFAAVDLTPLTLSTNGFDEISGWYNIIDFVGRCRGQIKVTAKADSIDEWKNCEFRQYLESSSSEDDFQSCNKGFVSRETTLSKSKRFFLQPYASDQSRLAEFEPPNVETLKSRLLTPDSEISQVERKSSETEFECSIPELDESASKSLLAVKLTDLDNLAQKLKERLCLDKGSDMDKSGQAIAVFQKTSFLASKFSILDSGSTDNDVEESRRAPFRVSAIEARDHIIVDVDATNDQQNPPIETYLERDLLTFSATPSDSDVLPELAEINWSAASPVPVGQFDEERKETRTREEDDKSRMAPEGGNPSLSCDE